MSKLVMLGMLAVLSGCVTDQDVNLLASNYYSRSDVDAITAQAQCKALARTLVQIARCDTWRK